MSVNQIKDFPEEVVQRMMECQVEQGNKADRSVFENYASISKTSGGFSWPLTNEGHFFWINVIERRNFNTFFAKYPKQIELTFPRIMNVKVDRSNTLKPRMVIGKFNGRFLYVIEDDYENYLAGEDYDTLTCLKAEEIPKIALPTINGYEPSDLGPIVKYGCVKVMPSYIKDLINACEKVSSSPIVKFVLEDEQVVTIEEVKKIQEYYQSKNQKS